MQLDDNYYLEKNDIQWTLKYSKTYFDENKQKEVTSKNEWFFNNISHALNSYIDKKLKASETVDMAIQLLADSVRKLKEKGFSLNK